MDMTKIKRVTDKLKSNKWKRTTMHRHDYNDNWICTDYEKDFIITKFRSNDTVKLGIYDKYKTCEYTFPELDMIYELWDSVSCIPADVEEWIIGILDED